MALAFVFCGRLFALSGRWLAKKPHWDVETDGWVGLVCGVVW